MGGSLDHNFGSHLAQTRTLYVGGANFVDGDDKGLTMRIDRGYWLALTRTRNKDETWRGWSASGAIEGVSPPAMRRWVGGWAPTIETSVSPSAPCPPVRLTER